MEERDHFGDVKSSETTRKRKRRKRRDDGGPRRSGTVGRWTSVTRGLLFGVDRWGTYFKELLKDERCSILTFEEPSSTIFPGNTKPQRIRPKVVVVGRQPDRWVRMFEDIVFVGQ